MGVAPREGRHILVCNTAPGHTATRPVLCTAIYKYTGAILLQLLLLFSLYVNNILLFPWWYWCVGRTTSNSLGRSHSWVLLKRRGLISSHICLNLMNIMSNQAWRFFSSFISSGQTSHRLTKYIIPIIFRFNQFQKTVPQALFLLHFPRGFGEDKSQRKQNPMAL